MLRNPLKYRVGCGYLVEGSGGNGGLKRKLLPVPAGSQTGQPAVSQHAPIPQEVTWPDAQMQDI